MADRLTKAALSAAQRGGLRGLFLFFGPEVQYKYVHWPDMAERLEQWNQKLHETLSNLEQFVYWNQNNPP